MFLTLIASDISLAADKKVEVFVTAWCPYCTKLESFLKKNDVDYTRYDVEQDADGGQIFNEIGGQGVPVTRVGSEVVHGYDPDGVMAAFKAKA